MENVIILGTGAAGLTAAIYTARAGLKPLLVEGLQPGGQLTTTTEVENFPGFPEGVDGTELMNRMRAQAEKFGTRFQFNLVTGSDLTGSPLKITLDDGVVLETRTLIVATGASAKYVGLPNEQKLVGRGVTSCATCDGAFYKNVPVAVVGGGDTAMEEANVPDPLCLQGVSDPSSRRISRLQDHVRARLNNPKIEVVWNTVVHDVLDVAKNEVTGLKLKNVQTGAISDLDVKALFVAIGHQPNTDAFKGQLDMDDKGYLKTQHTRTNRAGRFRRGRCAGPELPAGHHCRGLRLHGRLEAERYLETLHG
jgi:thioredoxin reductase (NADPH)